MASLNVRASSPSKKRAATSNSGSSKKKMKMIGKDGSTVAAHHKRNIQSGKSKSLKTLGEKEPSFTKNKQELSATKNRRAQKELAEARKRKRKPNYDLSKESVKLWEKMRQKDIDHEERCRLASQILKKMHGKALEMAVSHVASRVLQSCIKYCGKAEREAIFHELRPHLLTLARNTYACHLALKLFDHGSKEEQKQLISSLHANVVMLLRHPCGSSVVEHAYQLAGGAQKLELLSEFYSPEFKLFKGVLQKGKGRIIDVLAGEPISKRISSLEHMTMSLQPILEKGIVDHSIIHRAILEYLSICPKTMFQDVVQQLSGPLLIRMLHTRDGTKIGIVCVRHGSPKDRKKIVKGMKGHVMKIAFDSNGHLVLMSILDHVDDTKLVNEVIISELAKSLKDLALHKYGHRLLLHLLAPGVPRYFPADVLKVLSAPIELAQPSLENAKSQDGSMILEDAVKEHSNISELAEAREQTGEMTELGALSKKHPLVRRSQLLLDSGLAQRLTEACVEHAGELLRSPCGKDIIYEVATGGTDSLMPQSKNDVISLYEAIAELAAVSRDATAVGQDEHVLEHYHSSRTIRRLLLVSLSPKDVPKTFSTLLWKKALKGKCKVWAQGHSLKVVSALRECVDTRVKSEAEAELEGLDVPLKP